MNKTYNNLINTIIQCEQMEKMCAQGEQREIIMNNAFNNSITGPVYGMI